MTTLRLLLCAAAVVSLAGCSSFRTAWSGHRQRADVSDVQMTTAGLRGAPTPNDAPTYVARAAAGDRFEIESSQAALARSRNPEVISFARMMVDAHGGTSAAIAAAAAQAGVPAPTATLDADQTRMLWQLSRAPDGALFDRLYLRQQLSTHQQAVLLHNGYAVGGDTVPLRAAARRVLPTVRRHLGHVQRLQSVPLR